MQSAPIKRIVLQTPDVTKKNPSSVQSMGGLSDWVDSFVNKSNCREIERNFTSSITHAGFIHYLHLCWSRELGCEIRPDMLYYTIISEVATEILKNPEEYVQLFSNSQVKSTINVVDVGGIVKSDDLVEAMRNIVGSPDFLSIICDVKFDSDVKDASYSRKMVFASMGTPFYNYMGSKCGIPSIDIVGSVEDWNTLYDSVLKLSKFIPSKHFKYFTSISNTIAKIIYYVFGVEVHSDFVVIKEGATSEKFFNNIFNYGKNKNCGSGHPRNIVHGWAKLFYINGHQSEVDLSNLASHVNHVPFTLDYSDKMYCQAVTLAYSKLDGNTLRPCYGIITYEVTDEAKFNKIANPVRTDSRGRKYQPLSLNQLKEIVDNGKLYDPACTHYEKVTNVFCDRCREYMKVCIGYGEQNDLCLPCVDEVNAEWDRVHNK